MSEREPRINYGRAVEVEPFEEKPLLDQYFELRLERDRYRQALEEIVEHEHCYGMAEDMARKALEAP